MNQLKSITLLAAVADAQNTPVFESFLGKGTRIANQNLWAGGHSLSFDVFVPNLPNSCFQVIGCSHVSATEKSSYSSTQQWSKKVSTDLGLDASGMYGVASATVTASYGSTSSYEQGSTRSSFYSTSYNRQACYQMRPKCLFNKSYILPEVFEVAAKLPTDKSDPESMEQWNQQFLQRFGSHVTMASEHGAQVRSLTSIDTQTQTTNDCLKLKACADVGYLTNKAKVCPSSNTCSLHTNVDNAVSHSCVIAGGDSKQAAVDVLCSGNDTAAWEAFMSSGDMTSGSSAYSYKYKSIAQLLSTYGYAPQAAALENAVKKQGCVQPQCTYQQTGNGVWDAVCTLQCKNGGTADPTTCTCNCLGNANQGFRGTFCEKEYGICQPGRGSATIGPHCGDTAMCGSSTCSAASACCKAPLVNHGVCCAFGSACGTTPFTPHCVAAEESADSPLVV